MAKQGEQKLHWWFRAWYTVVYHTKHTPGAMAAFSSAMVALPYGLYRLSTWATNPEVNEEKARELRKKYNETLTQGMMAKVNKERLGTLLSEVQNREDNARYVAALDGQSLGTHSTGSTVGAVGISKDGK